MLSQKSLSKINLAVIKQNRFGDCCISLLGRRFLIDTNIHTISWEVCTANGTTFGTAIRKIGSKYAVGDYEYEWTDNGLEIRTKVHFTHDFKQIKKLIDEHVEYSERYRILDAHDQQVTWSVFAPIYNKPEWGKDLETLLMTVKQSVMPIKVKSSNKKAEFLAKCRRV